jgi:hypothetical protein
MPRQKTGRPVGKPPKYLRKDEQPVTVSLRIPRELAEQMKGYAKRHRQSATELLLDGLKWRLSGEDPRDLALMPSPRTAHDENENYCNTDIPTPVLDELHATLARQEKQLQALVQALEHRSVVAPEPGTSETFASNGNTVLQHTATDDTPGQAVELAPVPDAPEPRRATKRGKQRASETNIPVFDTGKYILGQLCPRGHDYHGTGQSLRRLHRHVCQQCDIEQKRQRRQGAPPAPPAPPAAPAPARRTTRKAQRV